MLRRMCLLFVFSCLVITSYASYAPFVIPCHPGDDKCILSSTQYAIPYLAKGITEFGIPSSDPIIIKNVTMYEGFVKMAFENMNVVGAKQCKALDIKRNVKESTVQLTMDCPVEATGKYKLTGRICFFDVNDLGDFKFKTDSVKTTITAKVKKTHGDDGKNYWELTSYDYSFEPAEQFHFELGNLFAGNVAISEPFTNLLNEDWKTSIKQMGEPVASSIVKHFFEVVKTFFLRVPIDQFENY